MTTLHAVKIDDENIAEIWWSALEEKYPALCAALRNSSNCGVVLSNDAFEAIAALPGFEDGPEYAQTALIDFGDEGENYGYTVAGRHVYFEAAR